MDLLQAKVELEEKRTELNDKKEKAKGAVESRDLATAKEIMADIDVLQAEINDLVDRVQELEVEEQGEDENEEEENTQIGGEDNMDERKILGGNEERKSFEGYLETRDITTDGLKLDEGFVVVPKEENKNIIELADDIVRLKDLVTVKNVTNGSGTQPVRTSARAKMSTVAELAESPALGVTPFTEVDYKVETKRAYIPYSNEYKQDGIDLINEVKQFIGEVVVNTENDDILTELGTVAGKTVKTVDELKTLVNTGFDAGKRGRIKFLVSQTVFDNLDRIKDKNGRYLLQESIASSTGYKLLGKDVEVLDDDYFPTKTTMFVGDLKEIIYFDRAETKVRWEAYMHYGECLGVAIRNDVGKIEDADNKVNIYKVTVNIPTEPVTAGA